MSWHSWAPQVGSDFGSGAGRSRSPLSKTRSQLKESKLEGRLHRQATWHERLCNREAAPIPDCIVVRRGHDPADCLRESVEPAAGADGRAQQGICHAQCAGSRTWPAHSPVADREPHPCLAQDGTGQWIASRHLSAGNVSTSKQAGRFRLAFRPKPTLSGIYEAVKAKSTDDRPYWYKIKPSSTSCRADSRVSLARCHLTIRTVYRFPDRES